MGSAAYRQLVELCEARLSALLPMAPHPADPGSAYGGER